MRLLGVRARSVPFEIACVPCGTVIEISKVALSVGWSLHGNQVGEPCGSPTTNAPSLVRTQPSIEPSGSVIDRGVPR